MVGETGLEPAASWSQIMQSILVLVLCDIGAGRHLVGYVRNQLSAFQHRMIRPGRLAPATQMDYFS